MCCFLQRRGRWIDFSSRGFRGGVLEPLARVTDDKSRTVCYIDIQAELGRMLCFGCNIAQSSGHSTVMQIDQSHLEACVKQDSIDTSAEFVLVLSLDNDSLCI